jgi:hypothetical protein
MRKAMPHLRLPLSGLTTARDRVAWCLRRSPRLRRTVQAIGDSMAGTSSHPGEK